MFKDKHCANSCHRLDKYKLRSGFVESKTETHLPLLGQGPVVDYVL